MSWRDIKFLSKRDSWNNNNNVSWGTHTQFLGCCRLSKCNANFGKFLKTKVENSQFH